MNLAFFSSTYLWVSVLLTSQGALRLGRVPRRSPPVCPVPAGVPGLRRTPAWPALCSRFRGEAASRCASRTRGSDEAELMGLQASRPARRGTQEPPAAPASPLRSPASPDKYFQEAHVQAAATKTLLKTGPPALLTCPAQGGGHLSVLGTVLRRPA